MSEKYRLIKHNKNLAEIGNDRGVGLLFLVDEDCERKLEIIVDLLNEKQEQLDLYKEAILTMLGLLADKGIIFSGVKDE